MSIRHFFLFGQDRYALPCECVIEVSSDRGSNDLEARPLDDFGLPEGQSDQVARVLYLQNEGERIAVRIFGQLNTLEIEDDQVVPLPLTFYPESPAVAFIVLEAERVALLLSPRHMMA